MDVNECGDSWRWRGKVKSSADDIPGFIYRSESLMQSLREVPQPGIPFAVVCSNAEDAGLKELARLKQLQSLSLARTQVTGAG